MSFLNTSTLVKTTSIIPSHITKDEVLNLLHDHEAMLILNPSPISYKVLPLSSTTTFYAAVAAAHKPPTASSDPIASLLVYAVTEHQEVSASTSTPPPQPGTENAPSEGANWKGSWLKRFVPNELSYQTSMQDKDDGLISITQAPMGVQSVTTWTVKDGEGKGLVLEKTGEVFSNRMLMGFIKGGLQESYERLAADFVGELGRRVAREKGKAEEGKILRVGETA